MALIVLFCIGLVGYDAGLRQKLVMEDSVLESLSQNDSHKINQSLSYAVSVVAEEEARVSKGVQEKVTPFEKALESLSLSQKETDLHPILGKSESDTRLWHALIAERHSEEVPGAELFVRNFQEEMKQNPEESKQTIGGALNRIPASLYPLEKAALLMLMDQIPGASSEAKSRGYSEMIHSLADSQNERGSAKTYAERLHAKSTTPDMLLPIVAQSIYLKYTEDPAEALEGTVQGISAQQNKRVRSTMAAQFVEKFPEMKSKLTESLSSQGIQIPSDVFK